MKLSFASLLAAAALSMNVAVAADPGELILTGGRIYTPQGWREALAVRDGRIVEIGSATAIQARKSPSTIVVDLAGRTVLPGLADMHVHPLAAGQSLSQCRFAPDSSREAIAAAVAACAKAAGPGKWVIGGQWVAAALGATPPDRAMLDRAAPDNPVLLTDVSFHSIWVNSKALALAGVTGKTPDPPGGVIDRGPGGEPTGVLREAAGDLVRKMVPPPAPEQDAADLARALDIMLSFGITSLTDAAVSGASARAYDLLADQGRLKQRVRGCLVWGEGFGSSGDFEAVFAKRASLSRDRFHLDCAKVFMDGVPTEGHTAAMLQPYAAGGAHGSDPSSTGLLTVLPAQLDALVERLDRLGVTVKFHAGGDQAVRTALDAVAAARRVNGAGGPSHDVAHNTFVDPADLGRARDLNATFEFSPYIWYPQPITDDVAKAVGAERMARAWPVREAIDAGADVVAGSDWSVVPSVNPWIGIETLVTRAAPDDVRPGQSVGAREAVSLKEALDLFTVNAARRMGQGDALGAIAPGKIADLIVVDRNPFEIPPTDIHNVVIDLTIVDGQIVYRRNGQP